MEKAWEPGGFLNDCDGLGVDDLDFPLCRK